MRVALPSAGHRAQLPRRDHEARGITQKFDVPAAKPGGCVLRSVAERSTAVLRVAATCTTARSGSPPGSPVIAAWPSADKTSIVAGLGHAAARPELRVSLVRFRMASTWDASLLEVIDELCHFPSAGGDQGMEVDRAQHELPGPQLPGDLEDGFGQRLGAVRGDEFFRGERTAEQALDLRARSRV